jgi:hypothetical protein
MRRRRTLDTRTLPRMRWLELLEQSPQIRSVHNGGRSKVAFSCMRLGWTQYKKRELHELYPKEELTADGRRVLAEWRAEQAQLEEA